MLRNPQLIGFWDATHMIVLRKRSEPVHDQRPERSNWGQILLLWFRKPKIRGLVTILSGACNPQGPKPMFNCKQNSPQNRFKRAHFFGGGTAKGKGHGPSKHSNQPRTALLTTKTSKQALLAPYLPASNRNPSLLW